MKNQLSKSFIVSVLISFSYASVTFNLNTSTAPGFTDSTSTILIRGTMNNWSGNAECGNVDGIYCTTGGNYVSTREKPYYAFCVQQDWY